MVCLFSAIIILPLQASCHLYLLPPLPSNTPKRLRSRAIPSNHLCYTTYTTDNYLLAATTNSPSGGFPSAMEVCPNRNRQGYVLLRELFWRRQALLATKYKLWGLSAWCRNIAGDDPTTMDNATAMDDVASGNAIAVGYVTIAWAAAAIKNTSTNGDTVTSRSVMAGWAAGDATISWSATTGWGTRDILTSWSVTVGCGSGNNMVARDATTTRESMTSWSVTVWWCNGDAIASWHIPADGDGCDITMAVRVTAVTYNATFKDFPMALDNAPTNDALGCV